MHIRAVLVTNDFARLAVTLPGLIAAEQAASAKRIAEDWAAHVREEPGADPVENPPGLRESITAEGNVAYTEAAHAVAQEYGTARIAANPAARQAAEREMDRYLDGLRGIFG